MLPLGARLAVLLVLPVLAGCVAPAALQRAGTDVPVGIPVDAVFDVEGPWSRTLVAGVSPRLAPEVVDVPSFDGTKINIGIFRPEVPEDVRVPVILDAGPYYDDGDAKVGSDQTMRLGGFLIENFVPHGYAVVQASIRGTGQSTGCLDYLGEKEQRDLDALVTWLGEQPWSNGNVGMIGRSYDGTTPYEVAAQGNPHLKTIVPISGITDMRQLHFRNGTAEPRSTFLGTLYYSYGAGETDVGVPPRYRAEEDPRAYARMACTEGPQHTPMGAAGYVTGGASTPIPSPVDSYWDKRQFTERVLAEYTGSLFYVHGLQDWNVVPTQGADLYNAFPGTKKALLGQWGHNYPDRPAEHEMLRWDWAEILLRWFDRELKGMPVDVGPDVEVMDNRGRWHVLAENAWPPADATWVALHPSAEGALVESGSEGSARLFAPAPIAVSPVKPTTPLGELVLSWESAPFPDGLHLSGRPRFHVTVEPDTPGGNLYALLFERTADGALAFVGQAQMDLRFAAGGLEMSPVAPRQPLLARMEFAPLDARLLANSSLVLTLTQEVAVDPLPNPATGPMTVRLGDDLTMLELPTVVRPWQQSRWDVEETKVLDETA